MSPALSLLSNNLQVYGPSESLPYLGVSGRAGSISPCRRSERRTLDMSVMSPKCYFRDKSFVCKARFGGQRRDSDFSKQNKHESSQIWTWQNEERDDSDDLSESEFLSAKNGRSPSLSTSKKDDATAAPGPREMNEIVELFKKVQASLRKLKGQKRFEAGKKQNNESAEIEPFLRLLSQNLSKEKKANSGFSNEFRVDPISIVREEPQETKRPSLSWPESNFQRRSRVPGITSDSIGSSKQSYNYVSRSDLEKSGETHSESDLGAEADFDFEPQETKRPSFSRPVSKFQRRSPVPRIRYELVVSSEKSYNSVSHSDLDEKSGETHSESDLGAEAEFDFQPDMDLTSEEEEEEELERAVLSEPDLVNGHAAGFSAAEEDNVDEREAEKQHTELKDLNAMKLGELREVARARGMKGYSKLKKSELLGLLSQDAI